MKAEGIDSVLLLSRPADARRIAPSTCGDARQQRNQWAHQRDAQTSKNINTPACTAATVYTILYNRFECMMSVFSMLVQFKCALFGKFNLF